MGVTCRDVAGTGKAGHRLRRQRVPASRRAAVSYTPAGRGPAVSRAQVWSLPAAIAVAPVSPETVWGVLALKVVPFPSAPKAFFPQHFAAPPLITAQV